MLMQNYETELVTVLLELLPDESVGLILRVDYNRLNWTQIYYQSICN